MKKTRSMLALLACLALLVSLCAVTVSAAETVTHTVDFRTLTDKVAVGTEMGTEEAEPLMESLGIDIPEDSSPWKLKDCYHIFATPVDGYQTCSFVQTLEAGEGKVFASDVNLTAGYWLAVCGDPSWFWVEVSTDGENWTEVFNDESGGRGAQWDPSAYAEGTIPLTGTAGASKVYVKYYIQRHDGETTGAISFSTLSATVKSENEVMHTVDFRTLTDKVAVGTEMGAVEAEPLMESLGIDIPEDSSPWKLKDCYHIFATPVDGYQTCSFVQTLEAGEGKVFASDVNLTAGYWLAVCGDPSWFWVEVSTDGENWTEVFNDESGGRGAQWDPSAYAEGTIPLTGTAGASKVYVKYYIQRHDGETTGAISFSTLTGLTKAAETVTPDPENPKDGDSVAVIAALALVCAAGAVITTKKFRKEEI